MTEKNKDVRVRFAPSPTGMLHIGGARTAVNNWAYARATGGKFILRIEDTDLARSTDENTKIILRAMKWLGLDYDEGPGVDGPYGPYFQLQRLDLYKAAIDELWQKDAAYPCFCTKEEIDAKREKAIAETGGYSGYDRTCRAIPRDVAQARMDAGESFVWRLKVPLDHKPIEFDDAVYGHMSFPADVMDDLVLTRGKDNIPTYNFAVVVDDSAMKITHVVRGDDHLSNTPRQILIYEALDKPVPTFAHLSMILGPDGKKLSKRHGSTSVEEYQARGYLPDALVNFLALLGWSLDDKTTIIHRDLLCSEFDLSRVTRKDSVFDEKKLDWMNGCYIREMGADKLAEISREWFAKSVVQGKDESCQGSRVVPSMSKEELNELDRQIKEFDEDKVSEELDFVDQNFDMFKKLSPLIIERLDRLDQIPAKLSFIFWGPNLVLDERSKTKVLDKSAEETKKVLTSAREIFADQSIKWDCDVLQTKCQELCEKLDIKPRNLFQPIRVAIAGNMVSPPLFECIELMKREDVVARIDFAISI